MIVDELMTGEKELAGDHYGKFVMRNCNIEYFKKRGCLKEGSYSSKEKVKKMFSDIVDTSLVTTMRPSHKRKGGMSDHDEESGFVVKKKKLFEDEVSIIRSTIWYLYIIVSLV